jgi:hypothetical protein
MAAKTRTKSGSRPAAGASELVCLAPGASSFKIKKIVLSTQTSVKQFIMRVRGPMLFVGSAANNPPAPVYLRFPLFFGRSPFFGFITSFATGLSVLYRPDRRWCHWCYNMENEQLSGGNGESAANSGHKGSQKPKPGTK